MAFHQVDISKKPVVYREATAKGRIILRKETIDLVKKGKIEKGDPLSLAAVAAVLAVKKTPEFIALSHPLKVEKVQPNVKLGTDFVEVSVTVSAHEKTGVEMEALTAVSAALLNVWDVVKAYEKDSGGQYPTTLIDSIRVVRKVKKRD